MNEADWECLFAVRSGWTSERQLETIAAHRLASLAAKEVECATYKELALNADALRHAKEAECAAIEANRKLIFEQCTQAQRECIVAEAENQSLRDQLAKGAIEFEGVRSMSADEAALRRENQSLRQRVEDLQKVIDSRREQRWGIDCTPDDGLAVRILEAYLDDGVTTVTEPKELGEMMNRWQAERQVLLLKAIAALSATVAAGKAEKT